MGLWMTGKTMVSLAIGIVNGPDCIGPSCVIETFVTDVGAGQSAPYPQFCRLPKTDRQRFW